MTRLTPLLLAGSLAAAATLGGCIKEKPSHDRNAVANDVRERALGVVAAYNRQDAHAAAAYDAPDYVGVYHGSPNTVGPAADEAGMKAQMAVAKVDWQLGSDKVTVAKGGDFAVFEAPYTFVVANVAGGGGIRETGTWIAIFRRDGDNVMKLWRSIASDSPPPKSAQAQPDG